MEKTNQLQAVETEEVKPKKKFHFPVAKAAYYAFTGLTCAMMGIKRTASREEKGIAVQRAEPVCRYVVKCSSCGTEFPRGRESKLIKYPEKFRCGLCRGRLVRVI